MIGKDRRISFFVIIFSGFASGGLAWALTNRDLGQAIAVGIGLAGLLYALRQFEDAGATLEAIGKTDRSLGKLARRLDRSVGGLEEKLADSVKELEGQLSTQELGKFPDFMPEIVSLLEGAKQRIVICCDHPAYGVFSNPRSYEDYVQVIRTKIRQDISVSLLCNDTRRRKELHATQIQTQGNWRTWQRKRRMRSFLLEHGAILEKRLRHRVWPELIKEDEFLEVLAHTDERALSDVFDGIPVEDKVTTDQVLPLYFWMVDGAANDAKAVFALAPLAKGALEVGFRTENPGLIRALEGSSSATGKIRNGGPRPGAPSPADPDVSQTGSQARRQAASRW